MRTWILMPTLLCLWGGAETADARPTEPRPADADTSTPAAGSRPAAADTSTPTSGKPASKPAVVAEEGAEAATPSSAATVVAPPAAAPATPAPASNPAPAKAQATPFPVKVSGFVNATIYAQDRAFAPSNGQGAWFPVAEPRGSDPWFFDGDVRNTRLRVSYDGPTLKGIKLDSVVEADFFGGFANNKHTGDEQPMPRLRLAYVGIKFWRLQVRLGQDWSPLFGNTPRSLSHVAFPLGYGSGGKIGWRYPGIFTTLTLTDSASPVLAQARLAVMRGSWSDMAGQAGIPQIEARFDLGSGAGSTVKWNTYLVGHYDQKDISGPGKSSADDKMHGYAGEFGASLAAHGLLLHGNIYVGRAIGQQFGQLLQLGDIRGWGGWAQAGYNITKDLAVFVFYGIADPDDDDIASGLVPEDGQQLAKARLRNQQLAVAVHYAIGPLTLGLEYFRADLDHLTVDAGGNADRDHIAGQQISFNTLFKF